MASRTSKPRRRAHTMAMVFRTRELGRLNGAAFGASLAEHGGWMALLLYAYQRGGVEEVGWVAALLLIPAAAVAPLAGTAADVVAPRRALPIGLGLYALSVAATGAAIVAGLPAGIVYALAGIYSVMITFYRPAIATVFPLIAESFDDIVAANVGFRAARSLGRLAGPAIAGLVLLEFSPGVVLLVFAVIAGAGALALIGEIPHRVVDHEDDPTPGALLAETKAGVLALRHNREARTVISVLVFATIVNGALDVAAAGVAIDLLGRNESSVSILIGAFGLGSVLGAAGGVVLIGRTRLAGAVVFGSVLSTLCFAAVAYAPAMAAATALMVLAGLGGSVTSIAGRTMLEGLSAEDTIGRFFGVLESLNTIGLAVGGLAISALTAAFGLETALLIVGLVVLALALSRWMPLRTIDAGRSEADRELLDLVRASPIFSPLAPYTIEQLLQHLQLEEFSPDQRIMQRGDIGARMLLVSDGEVLIRVVSGETLRRGRADYVGEVALLSGAPRNADVDAGPAGATGYWLDAEVFLTAMTSAARSLARVEAEARRRTPEA